MCHPQFAARLSTVQTLLDPMKSMCSYHPTEVRRLSGPIELYPMRSVCAWWPSYFVVRLLTCRWISHFVRRGQCDTRPTVTFPAAVHHCHVTGTNLSFLVRVLSGSSSRGLYVVGNGRWMGCWLIDWCTIVSRTADRDVSTQVCWRCWGKVSKHRFPQHFITIHR